MAYQKRNFKKDQLLTADDLNSMDLQIYENCKKGKTLDEGLIEAQAKIIEISNTVNGLILDKLAKDDVVQTSGDSTEKVMSQKAVTEGLENLSDNKLDKTSILHTTGAAEDMVISQRATTEELEKKFDKSNVVQSTGNAEDKVMSQATATKEFSITEKRITNLEAGLPAERWLVDDSVAYIKEVPENALPFASVDTVGGMTRKCTNILPSAVATVWNCTCTVESDGKFSFTRTESGGSAFIETATVYLNANKTYIVNVNGTNWKYGFISKSGVEPTPNEVIYGRIDYTPTESGYYEVILYMTDESTAGTTGYAYIWINDGEYKPYEPYFDGLRSAPATEVESVGANLIPFPYTITDGGGIGGVTWKSQDDGAIVFNGSWDFAYTNNVIFTTDIPLKAGTYHISDNAIGDGGLYVILQYTNSGGTLSYVYAGRSFTIETDTTVSAMFQLQPYTTYSNKKIYPLLNKGATALPYTPYRRNTLPITAAVQALDGYGWGVNYAVYNYIDWEKKQFVKRVGRVDLGTLDWVLNYGVYFTTNIPGKAKGIRNFIVQNGEISPTYSEAFDDTFPYGTWGGDSAGNYVIYKAFNGEYADVTAFETAMSGVMLYYELATPVITDISDLLHEDNLIGVEGGGTVTMVNEYGYDVPSEITYQLKGAEA